MVEMQKFSQFSDDYRAAIEDAAFYVVPNPGYLRISGETHEDYIQRQTSNDLRLLSPFRAVQTILPSPTGRIYEVLTLINDSSNIGMLTQPGHGSGLAAYFQKRTFFNDEVAIGDVSREWAQIEIHGPAATKLLKSLGAPAPSEIDGVAAGSWKSIDYRAIGLEGFSSDLRFLLVFPVEVLSDLTAEFLMSNIPQLKNETRQTLRIERGLAGDPEFTDEYTPFEVGLERLVSSEKGCYTGQEVLARQVTYDKVVRRLVQLTADRAIASGGKLEVEGKQVGEVTSAAFSPSQGNLALGVVRKPHDQPGTHLSVGDQGTAITVI